MRVDPPSHRLRAESTAAASSARRRLVAPARSAGNSQARLAHDQRRGRNLHERAQRRVRAGLDEVDDPEQEDRPVAQLEYMVEPIADDVELDLPDGLLAVPVVVANLSPATRGNVLLHVVALVLATSFYAEALAEEANGRAAFLHLIAILIENYFFYCAVLNAIEEAEDELAGGAE
jgi:hypothetical protein